MAFLIILRRLVSQDHERTAPGVFQFVTRRARRSRIDGSSSRESKEYSPCVVWIERTFAQSSLFGSSLFFLNNIFDKFYDSVVCWSTFIVVGTIFIEIRPCPYLGLNPLGRQEEEKIIFRSILFFLSFGIENANDTTHQSLVAAIIMNRVPSSCSRLPSNWKDKANNEKGEIITREMSSFLMIIWLPNAAFRVYSFRNLKEQLWHSSSAWPSIVIEL